jgi:hypothetical protein
VSFVSQVIVGLGSRLCLRSQGLRSRCFRSQGIRSHGIRSRFSFRSRRVRGSREVLGSQLLDPLCGFEVLAFGGVVGVCCRCRKVVFSPQFSGKGSVRRGRDDGVAVREGDELRVHG